MHAVHRGTQRQESSKRPDPCDGHQRPTPADNGKCR